MLCVVVAIGFSFSFKYSSSSSGRQQTPFAQAYRISQASNEVQQPEGTIRLDYFHEPGGADTLDLQVWKETPPPFRVEGTEKSMDGYADHAQRQTQPGDHSGTVPPGASHPTDLS
jgi:hypothetical protein